MDPTIIPYFWEDHSTHTRKPRHSGETPTHTRRTRLKKNGFALILRGGHNSPPNMRVLLSSSPPYQKRSVRVITKELGYKRTKIHTPIARESCRVIRP